MLDIQYIREFAEQVKLAATQKGLNPEVVDEVLRLDAKRRELLQAVEQLRSQRNDLNTKLKSRPQPELIEQSKALKSKLQDLEPELKQVESALHTMMLQIPNVPGEDVPVGPDSSGNKQVATWGEKPQFAFTPKDHIELGVNLDIVDFDRGAK